MAGYGPPTLLQEIADALREARGYVDIASEDEDRSVRREIELLDRIDVVLRLLPPPMPPVDTRSKTERVLTYLAPRTYCNKTYQNAVTLVRKAQE